MPGGTLFDSRVWVEEERGPIGGASEVLAVLRINVAMEGLLLAQPVPGEQRINSHLIAEYAQLLREESLHQVVRITEERWVHGL